MSAEHVQTVFQYQFADSELLSRALRAAHRSDEDDTGDDGNRGLAELGECAINIAQTEYAVTIQNKTKREVNKSQHWYKTKKGRASTCKRLGIVSYVVQSIRQQHIEPSLTVLANTISAIFGAVWLDVKKRGESGDSCCSTILKVLRHIDEMVADTTTCPASTITEKASIDSQSTDAQTTSRATPNVMTPDDYYCHDTIEAAMLGWFKEIAYNTVDELETSTTATNDIPSKSTNESGSDISVISQYPHRMYSDTLSRSRNEGPYDAYNDHPIQVRDPRNPAKCIKRKYSNGNSERSHNELIYLELLQEERQKSDSVLRLICTDPSLLLDHPQLEKLSENPTHNIQLRFWYLAIGSSRSIVDFKQQLHFAREGSVVPAPLSGLDLGLKERFGEICRLEGEEAFCVLARRFHIMKLCEIQSENFLTNYRMVVQTAHTFGTGHRARRGNPILLEEAELIDALLFKINPEVVRDTEEFKKMRLKIKGMRRIWKRLQILTKTFGHGILAILPSGPIHSGLSLTDTS
ncbi:hypothetical protein B0J11DRAFT_440000 [Dendryphion nanum]|uniref:Uncharacterized protein n=1 Tax=Dendryphion nanum TaxID=256645 RepID=A0A9P9IHV0_9PLEO|nr:hypothetical protein B0J11DRAFT_440000 [Dendryphion nanum]